MKFLPYNRQSIDQTDIAAVSDALQKEIITRGEHVEAFERALAEYCGAQYAVAFNSATSGLLAACYAAEIKAGDRVISTPNTFVSTVGSPVQFGATPIFVDIDRTTGNFDLEQVAATLNQPASRGRDIVMPVHFSGIPVDMQALEQSIARPDTVVIEDAAHAIGSLYKNGERVGNCRWSDMTVFSFHPVKNMTTGEGGVVTTNRKEYYDRLRLYRSNGIVRETTDPWHYEVRALSGNYNFTDFQAALGISQMKRLDAFIQKRRKLVKRYRQKLAEYPRMTLFTDALDEVTAFHLFVVQIEGLERTRLMEQLQKQGVGSQLHYIPVYRHPVFQKICGDIADYFPNMETYYQQALSLPLFVDMEESDVDRVVSVLAKAIK